MIDQQFLECLGNHLFNYPYNSNFQFGSLFTVSSSKKKKKVSFPKKNTNNICNCLKIFLWPQLPIFHN